MNNLKITIEGAPATGKTTLSLLIAAALRAAGIDFVVFDDDDVANERSSEAQALYLAAMAKKTFVEIETLMARKEPESEPEEPSWSTRRSGAQALVMAMWDGTVRGRGTFTVRDLHDANFVAMVDPENDGDTGVVSKCRYGIHAHGTVLTHEHLGDIALAYSAITYANDHVFVDVNENPLVLSAAHARYETFINDLVRACREVANDKRRAALSHLIASIL